MSISRRVGVSVFLMLSFISVGGAQDLSAYRGFRFGANADAVGALTGNRTIDLRTVSQRPALIEELEWNPHRGTDTPAIADALRTISFTFYNHELFRMVVMYDPVRTEGLTNSDIIEAISKEYGTPTTPDGVVTVSPLSSSYPDTQKVVAVWDSSEYSYSLFHSAYGSMFGLVIVSKQADSLAKTASEQSVAQDRLEAPQRELDRKKQLEADRRDADAKARLNNKPTFRP